MNFFSIGIALRASYISNIDKTRTKNNNPNENPAKPISFCHAANLSDKAIRPKGKMDMAPKPQTYSAVVLDVVSFSGRVIVVFIHINMARSVPIINNTADPQ